MECAVCGVSIENGQAVDLRSIDGTSACDLEESGVEAEANEEMHMVCESCFNRLKRS